MRPARILRRCRVHRAAEDAPAAKRQLAGRPWRCSQIVCVADARKLCLLLIRAEAGEKIFVQRVDALHICYRFWRQRCPCGELLPVLSVRIGGSGAPARIRARDETVPSERLAIKENLLLQSERAVKHVIVMRCVGRDIDAQILNHASGDWTIGSRALDRVCAAIAEQKCSVDIELVALGMAAEIIVVFENEHARLFTCGLMEKSRRRKPADTPSNHDQIISFSCVDGLAGVSPEAAVAQAMRNLIRSIVAAAHAMKCGRIIARLVLWFGCLSTGALPEEVCPSGNRPTNRHRRAVHEIAARNHSIHTQFFVGESHSKRLPPKFSAAGDEPQFLRCSRRLP